MALHQKGNVRPLWLAAFVFTLAATTVLAVDYSSSDACFDAIAAQNLNKTTYGSKLYSPCTNAAPRPFVYSSESASSYGCVNRPTFNNANRWQIQLFSSLTTHYSIWSSTGANSSGITFCASVPYKSSDSTDYTSYGAPTPNVTNITKTNTPIEAANNQAWIDRYGTPKRWVKTRTIETTTRGNNNNSSTTTVADGIVGIVSYQ